MFVSDKLVYVELHKTGCTHIRNILHELLGGELIGEHNQVWDELLQEGRLFVGSIRDPWEWYTSLWAYGCDHKGSVYDNATKGIVDLGWRHNPASAILSLLHYRSSNRKRWLATYTNVNDPAAFQAWLNMVHSAEYIADIDEGFAKSPVSGLAGLLTYRFLVLYCLTASQKDVLGQLSTYQKIKEFAHANCFIDHFVRNESLELDLFQILEGVGIKVTQEEKERIRSRPRSNVSSRKHDLMYYYDPDTESIIADREQFIIEEFGYTAPSSRQPAADSGE